MGGRPPAGGHAVVVLPLTLAVPTRAYGTPALGTPRCAAAVVARYRRQLETYSNLAPTISRSSAHFFQIDAITTGGWSGSNISFVVRVLGQAARASRVHVPLAWPRWITVRLLIRGRRRSRWSASGRLLLALLAFCAHAKTGRVGGRSLPQSTDDPRDPLLQSMRRDGTLLPLRWCANGSLVPAAVARAPYDAFWGPLLSTEEEAVAAMRQQAAAAAEQEASQVRRPCWGA